MNCPNCKAPLNDHDAADKWACAAEHHETTVREEYENTAPFYAIEIFPEFTPPPTKRVSWEPDWMKGRVK